MNDMYLVFIIPLLSFVISGFFAIFLYYKTRQFWRKVLDSSRGARFLYITVAIIVLPLILGGWSDIVDISEILQGNLAVASAIPLSVLACLLVMYLYLHGCWFDREEYALVARANEAGRIAELDCQKNYLVRLLENFRVCIGRYAARLRELAHNQTLGSPLSARVPKNLAKENIRMIIESVRQTYRSIETVPKDYGIKILLLEKRGNYLEHRESYDGTTWDCYKVDCDSHIEQYFNLAKATCSVAVACATSGTIQVIESCEECHRDDSHPFWYFQDRLALQKEELGSMVVIPFEPEQNQKYVLCITCSQPMAFLKKHLWKAKAVQENVQARIALLQSQNEVLNALCQESAEALRRIEALDCEIESLKSEHSAALEACEKYKSDLANSLEKHVILSEKMESLKLAKYETDADLAKTQKSCEDLASGLAEQRDINEKLDAELKEIRNDLSEPKEKNTRRRKVQNTDKRDEGHE
jgi:hypothetical protein